MLKFSLVALGFANVLADIDLNLTTTTFNLNEANKHLWLSAAGKIIFFKKNFFIFMTPLCKLIAEKVNTNPTSSKGQLLGLW
jgi:hypothetical protein